MKEKKLLNEVVFYIFIIIAIGMLIFTLGGNKNKTDETETVGIHIKGEVRAPGYYELDYGSRVKDAIIIAGGEEETANLMEINMARKISDGEEIIIPAVNNPEAVLDIELININTADMYQLCKLDGIGESIAADILEYRAKNGAFSNINQLKNVNGIGDAKFDKIKEKITV